MNYRRDMPGNWIGIAPVDPVDATRGSRDVQIMLAVGLIALVVITVTSAFRSVHQVHKAQQTAAVLEINDFDRWMQLIPAHLEQRTDLVDERSANTVLDMILLGPFTHLSRAGSAGGVDALQAADGGGDRGGCVWHGAASRRDVECDGGGADFFRLGVKPVLGDIQEGQTNLLMLLPLTAGLWLGAGGGETGAGVGGGAPVGAGGCDQGYAADSSALCAIAAAVAVGRWR